MIKFHFLNVGHGDTTIIDLPDDSIMVVDFNRDNEFDEDTAKELAEAYKINFDGSWLILKSIMKITKTYFVTFRRIQI